MTERRGNKQFKKTCEMMLGIETMTFEEYCKAQKSTAKDAGVEGWKSKIPGAKNADSERLKIDLMMMDNFDAEDRAKVTAGKINGQDRARIAQASGVHVSQVNLMLRGFGSFQIFHSAVNQMHAKGMELPDSQEDFHARMATFPLKLTGQQKKDMKKMQAKQMKR